MIKISLLTAAALLAAISASPANAGVSRAWVSGHGTDAAGCGAPTSPCRSLQYVVSNIIAPSGEIDILDPAGYGTVTIPFALSIINDGVGTAGVQEGDQYDAAITISAGASDNVTLRGLNIDGLGTGGVGILFKSGGSLTIVNCVVRHFALEGIDFSPTSGSTRVSISNTIVSDNGYYGIILAASGAVIVEGVISQTTTNDNGYTGIYLDSSSANVIATVVDCVAFNNASYGFTSNGTGADMLLGHSVAAGNIYGVYITGGGTAHSYGDNKLGGNNNAVYGSLMSYATQ
jgi:hypothetical protein